jgi:hypothetical protein
MNLAPFARLLGLQRSAHARERLHELRQRHALTDHDPVWELVAVVEEFCADLKSEIPNHTADAASEGALPPTAANATAPQRSLQSAALWRIAALCCAGAALQTCALAASFYLGTCTTRGTIVLTAALSVPAGWIMFTLLLPLLWTVAYLGWRNRRIEPAIGWTLATLGTTATAALFVTLWRLL